MAQTSAGSFWLILTQITLNTHQILWPATHRGRNFSLVQKHPDLFPGKGKFHYTSATSRLERTQQTLVLAKDLAWDKIKSSLNKQKNQFTFSNRKDIGQFHQNTSKIVLPATNL